MVFGEIHEYASMGPRLFSRGKIRNNPLLRGHCHASMGPRLFSRGKNNRVGYSDALEPSGVTAPELNKLKIFNSTYMCETHTLHCCSYHSVKTPNHSLDSRATRLRLALRHGYASVLAALDCCIFSNVYSCERRSVSIWCSASRRSALQGQSPPHPTRRASPVRHRRPGSRPDGAPHPPAPSPPTPPHIATYTHTRLA